MVLMKITFLFTKLIPIIKKRYNYSKVHDNRNWINVKEKFVYYVEFGFFLPFASSSQVTSTEKQSSQDSSNVWQSVMRRQTELDWMWVNQLHPTVVLQSLKHSSLVSTSSSVCCRLPKHSPIVDHLRFN